MAHAIVFDTLAYAKKQDLKELELRLTVKVGAMLIALAMILFAGLPLL